MLIELLENKNSKIRIIIFECLINITIKENKKY